MLVATAVRPPSRGYGAVSQSQAESVNVEFAPPSVATLLGGWDAVRATGGRSTLPGVSPDDYGPRKEVSP